MTRALALVLTLLAAAPASAFADDARQSTHARAARTGSLPSAVETLASANAAARQRPAGSAFAGARQVYVYEEGAIYELLASPSFVSSILLEPGESLLDIAAGDTSLWMVTQASAETDAQARTIVLVKPQPGAGRTNIVLMTNRRIYLVEALARAGETYAAQIAWTYPPSATTPQPAPGPINDGYRIRTIGGSPPAWAPLRVYDDGSRTFIEFPSTIAAAEMAPLFVIGAEGAELVNYRVVGARYVVDRLFDRAELRLGARTPVIVAIIRVSQSQRSPPRRRSGRP